MRRKTYERNRRLMPGLRIKPLKKRRKIMNPEQSVYQAIYDSWKPGQYGSSNHGIAISFI